MFKKYIFLFFYIFLFVSCQQSMVADLIIVNGQVYTAERSEVRAESVVCKDGKIILVGSNKQAEEFKAKSTKIIDAKQAFVMPGLIEGHGHYAALGYSLIELNLIKSRSWEEILEQVAVAKNRVKPGEWIIGRGWHQEKWDSIPTKNILNYPFHESLSAISQENPVVLYHASGHSLYANQKAMEAAGITKETQNPVGGEIVRDPQGNAIGVFEERAMSFITDAHDQYTKNLNQETLDSIWFVAIKKAESLCLSNGITSFQDAGSKFPELIKYEKLAEEQKLNVRLWVMARHSYEEMTPQISSYKKLGIGNHFYTCNAIKSEVDGALGAFGAWLLKPYNDKPGFSGQNTTDIYEVKKIADLAIQHNMQFCVHAIGDRANRVVLDIYEGVMDQNPNKKDWRWRIEHAQHVDTTDIPRFAKRGIIASMQGIHCTSDAPFVVKRLGPERAKTGAYAWRSFLDKGVIIANGTDAPVEDVNPFQSIYASVTRKNDEKNIVFFPEQKMTRHEALYSYTLGNAFAAFEEDIKGSLTPGKMADIIILDQNLLTCPDEQIKKTNVLTTIVNGQIKYQK